MLLTSSGDARLRGWATEGHPENGVGVGSQPVSSTSVQSRFPPDPLPLSMACSSCSDPAHHPTRSLKGKGFFAQDFCPFSLDVSRWWQVWGSHLGTEIFSTGGIVGRARWG